VSNSAPRSVIRIRFDQSGDKWSIAIMRTHVEFRSDAFVAVPGEDEVSLPCESYSARSIRLKHIAMHHICPTAMETLRLISSGRITGSSKRLGGGPNELQNYELAPDSHPNKV
jgi:hypothetical protein